MRFNIKTTYYTKVYVIGSFILLTLLLACKTVITELNPRINIFEKEYFNVILIMADDLGYECIGAYGGTSYRTPNIDNLAKGGIRFNKAFSQPMCTPSRVKIMTGKSNVRNYTSFATLDKNETTFGNLLQNSGYETCITGKWQLGGERDRIKHFGFNKYCVHAVERWNFKNHSRYPNPGLAIDGELVSFDNGEYGPDVILDYAINFIESNQEKPFFLYYPMNLVHRPFEPTPDSDEWDPSSVGIDNLKTERTGKSIQEEDKYFSDMVHYMDKIIGKLINELEVLGLRNNTVIIFTGDNGTTPGIKSVCNDKLVIGRKSWTTDAGTHVPLIVNCPGYIPKGQVSNDLIDFSDILPTICEITQTTIPDELSRTLDGRSFLPQLLGQKGNPRKWIYSWYQDWRYTLGTSKKNTVWENVSNGRYKLYSSGYFYDLEKDIYEKKHLDLDSLSDEQKVIRNEFQTILDQYAKLRPKELRDENQRAGRPLAY